jgi:radical SAM superfamily enzyme YgiQ (UPF0313 family)
MNGQNPCPIEEPLGLLALATYLGRERPDIQIDIYDACVSGKEPEEVVKEVSFGEYDLFCVSLLTPSAPGAFSAAKLIRRLRKREKPVIVFGGPHATALPEECIKQGADICITGEGEKTLSSVVAWYEAGAPKQMLKGISGIASEDEYGNIWKTDNCSPIELDDVSPMSYKKVEKYRYQTDAHITAPGKARSLMFSRGCVHNCSYCCSTFMWKRTLRQLTPYAAVEELERSVQEGYVCFHFYDDDFMVSRLWLRTFAEEIIRRNLAVQYTCLSSCKSFLRVDEDTLKLLKTSGMSLVEIGVESMQPEVLDLIGKNQSVSEVVDVFARADELDINIFPLLLMMAPGETLAGHLRQERLMREIVGRSVYLLESLGGNVGVFLRHGAFYTPYPGTRAWFNKEKQGIVIDNNWSNWTTAKMCFVPNTLLYERPVNVKKDLQINCTDIVVEHMERFLSDDNALSIAEAIGHIGELATGKKTILDISESVYDKYGCMARREAVAFTIMAVLTKAVFQETFISKEDI